MSLESDNDEEDQEVLDDLEHEEEDEVLQVEVEHEDDSVEQGEAVAGAAAAQEDDVAYCIPCKGNVCYCEDERQVTFFKSEAEYYEQLEKDSNVHPEDPDEDHSNEGSQQVTFFTDDE